MIQSFRQLKDRIKSIENTRKITRAMEMVSAAKLNRVKNTFFSSKHYFADLERILSSFLSDIGPTCHPLLENRPRKRATAITVITSDTGLCSTYNSNVIKVASEFADQAGKDNVKIIAVGKEAFSHFKKDGYDVKNTYLGIRGKFSEKIITEIANELINTFVNQEVDEACIAYTHFSPTLRHKPVIEKFLPINYHHKARQYYILEPEKEIILDNLVAKYLLGKLRIIFLDSLTAEHSARMLAMKLATDNADDLIDTLTLQKNKARQFAITKEVLEIAMSAEAVKG